jgi:pyruvate/2-oxoglutarate dehydrogenase complex dihydrolipoamide acyltransferase (E2) component
MTESLEHDHTLEKTMIEAHEFSKSYAAQTTDRSHRTEQPKGGSPARERGASSRPFPSGRRLVTAAVRAGRRIAPMTGLFQVDITTARRLLAETTPPLSLTAYVVACVGRAAANRPEVHAYRDWRGRLVEHRHVDIQVLIEVPTSHGPFALVHVVADADLRSVADITAEIRAIKAQPAATGNRRLLDTLAPALGRIPGLYRSMYAVMGRSHRVRNAIGTVQVTALGMFADGGGFAIAPPTLASLAVVVGGISKSPVEVDGHIEARELLDLTVSIDHNVVDGAPATRFVADLRRVIQTAVVLESVAEGVGDSSAACMVHPRVITDVPLDASFDIGIPARRQRRAIV